MDGSGPAMLEERAQREMIVVARVDLIAALRDGESPCRSGVAVDCPNLRRFNLELSSWDCSETGVRSGSWH